MKYYSRYMDDGIIICESKDKLRSLLNDITKECEIIGLKLNETKARIYKLKEGFTYLGFRYMILPNGKILMKIPKAKRQRIKRYLKTLDDTKDRIVFYKDYLLKGNNYIFYRTIKNNIKRKKYYSFI